ncbi:hypothetical protein ACGFX2_23430 [Streptomyces goshikiensis]|uniref:hypothetical protein n=1 Tax=Streptomyces goshikiensis TaxID=1942 RepID=UPI0037240B4F
MADVYELLVALDLRGDLSEREVAELRWHLGLGPAPQTLHIVSSFPVVVEDDDGEPVVEDHPEPLLGRHDAAWRVGGALVSALVRSEPSGTGSWALTARQEVHPDEFELTGELLGWLAARADARHSPTAGTVRLGWTRFHESDRYESLTVRDGRVEWP